MTTIASIIAAVAARYDLKPADLTRRDRHRNLARPRQEAYWLARQVTDRTLPEIGMAFRRHHATVLHGIRLIERTASDDHKAELLRMVREADTTRRTAA